jgi:hypothetical protein
MVIFALSINHRHKKKEADKNELGQQGAFEDEKREKRISAKEDGIPAECG